MAQKSSPNLGNMLFASTFQGQKLENKEISQSRYQRASREVENCTAVSVFANFSTHLSIRLSKICSYPPLASQPASQPTVHPSMQLSIHSFIHPLSIQPLTHPTVNQAMGAQAPIQLLSCYPLIQLYTTQPVWLRTSQYGWGWGSKTGMSTQYTL